MSNARKLALVEKWTPSTSSSPKGAHNIPPLSSPTSPKVTKFCCCPNRRRYNLKQPKLTTTLHVRNIFVDNDFNFIDANDDAVEGSYINDERDIPNVECNQNYKRAESWPSARRATRPKNATANKINIHNQENRYVKNKVTSIHNADNNYDDIIENYSVQQRIENEENSVIEPMKQVWHEWNDKSCKDNRNNCQRHQHCNRKTKNSTNKCSMKWKIVPHQERTHKQEQTQRLEPLLSQTFCNEPDEAETASDLHKNEKPCEKPPNLPGQSDDQIATLSASVEAKKNSSPLFQRFSEVSELKSKKGFSNKQLKATEIPTSTSIPCATSTLQHCRNCQFCFNQNCLNFSQLQHSLHVNANDPSCHISKQQYIQKPSTACDIRKMSVSTAANVVNNFEYSLASDSTTIRKATAQTTPNSNDDAANNCDPLVTETAALPNTNRTQKSRIIPNSLLLTSTTTTIDKMPTTPTSSSNCSTTSPVASAVSPHLEPTPRSCNSSLPLTTTVIKTTMVKRSPANEVTTFSTTPTSPSAKFSSLTLEKYLAFVAASTAGSIDVHDATVEQLTRNDDKSTANKCLTNATASAAAPLSVKERIAALVAGNEHTQHQHDNFINRTSLLKNQCNKPKKSTSQNMTCPQRQPLQSLVIDGNSTSSNMCQQSPLTNTRTLFTTATNNENDVDSGSMTKAEANDNANHKSFSGSTCTSPSSRNRLSATAAVLLRTSKPSLAATVPQYSLNNLHQHHNDISNYESNTETTMSSLSSSPVTTTTAAISSAVASPSLTTSNLADAITVDSQQQCELRQHILSNTISPATVAAATLMSSSNDTTDDKIFEKSDLTQTERRSKLAALDNLDLALNLSDLSLDVDDDDDPYNVLQEYLERVKHEINEVFELHKARQKIQPQQQQSKEQEPNHQPFERDSIMTNANLENHIKGTINVAVSNDELSRSTESDSGFESATGGGTGGATTSAHNNSNNNIVVLINSGSHKLLSRAIVITSNEIENGNNAKHNKNNEHDENTKAMRNGPAKNEQPPLELVTFANSKEFKPPKNPLIPLKDEGKQAQDDPTETSVSTKISLIQSSSRGTGDTASANALSSTIKRLRKQLETKTPAEVATDDVNMWANKFLRDLDNLMTSDKIPSTSSSAGAVDAVEVTTANVAYNSTCTSPGPTSPMLLSAAATAVIQSRYGKGSLHDRLIARNSLAEAVDLHDCNHQGNVALASNQPLSPLYAPNGLVLRPEKHATIPLQSFNLGGGVRTASGPAVAQNAVATNSGGNMTKANVAYLRTLSAPTPPPSQTMSQSLFHDYSDKKSTRSINSSNVDSQLLGQRNSLAVFVFNSAAAFDQQPQDHQNQTNFQSQEVTAATESIATDGSNNTVDNKSTIPTTVMHTPMTVLKIEETSPSAITSSVHVTKAASATQSVLQGVASATSSEETVTCKGPATDVESLHQKRLLQLNIDMDNIRNTSIDQSQQLSALMRQNHYCTGGTSVSEGNTNYSNGNKLKTLMASSICAMPKKASTTAVTATSNNYSQMTSASTKQHDQKQLPTTSTAYLLQTGSDVTKKGSTSTIWTSEESILRSVGAVDEDNNSTSSSACEEASGILSSGKSGISLDSSGVENDNNESGIGTATPPKDMFYWKSSTNPQNRHQHHHAHGHHVYNHSQQQDNDSMVSLDVLRKMKFQKGSSITSSDDPDLLEVLSLCNETIDDEDAEVQRLIEGTSLNKSLKSNNDEDMDDYDLVDEEDEGHDEFDTVPYCDCDFTEDGENSSVSAGSSITNTIISSQNHVPLTDSTGVVILRRKYAASPITVPQKSRSHSLDTSSLPNSYQHGSHHQNQQHSNQHLHNHHSHVHLARKLQHLRDRQKDRTQLSLALRQEPFQSLLAPSHFHELPSPSSASLHSGHEILDSQELSMKSNSAPLLLKQEKRRDDFTNQNVTLRYSRSQSDRYLAEIEAVEACKWLRAAGFPQYAQMYEDHQFPIDLTNVAKDHTNLENDQLQSLYRRLCILNRCANMRIDQSHKTPTPQQKDDSDDENFALSENWTFQRNIRRWSRIGEMGLEIPPAAKLTALEKTESSSKESSPDRFEDDSYDVTGGALSLALPGSSTDASNDPHINEGSDLNASPLRRTGSERLKDGAKAILKRVESIKSRRRKRQGIVISGPQTLDLSQLGQRTSARKPDAVYSTPPSPSAVSPMHSFNKGPLFGNDLKVPSQSDTFLSPNRGSPKRTPTTPRSMRTSPLHFFTNTMPYLKEGKSDDSSSYYSDSQESSSVVNRTALRKIPSKTRRFLQRTGKVDDIGAYSDSECHQGRKLLIKDANANTTELKTKKLSRGGSLNLGRDGKKRDGFRSASFRSRSTTRKEPKPEETETIKKAPVVRWHSFQLEERPHMVFRKCFSQKNDPHSNEHGIVFAAMSAGQLQMIRKLALVTLTGYMERYCPTHRSGWNWELPKFIKKIKMPDYKDKKVFGVPLLLILQRSGQTLPIAVRAAFRWLQLNALDQTGLFRKSGVKSRILKLKELIEYSESTAECMDIFDTQQAYDVADMLKQYFRDLPESLLTTKMSETFAAIFQHLPPEVRLDAIQSAVLLLPDENREILYALLEFLTLVAANSHFNQMTANNLAVCLAPSLFHSSISTGTNSVTASPRRGKGKGSGVPDAKELFEAKASHECLSFMIENYKKIYTAPKEKLSKCKFGYMEESKPLPLEALGEGMQFHNWRGYLYESTSATIKEGREKSRGWITITSLTDSNVEIAYKKVGDGHPLRLWRCITEVEGPPKDVLDYIIRLRASWDPNLLQSQTIKKFDECTEIFQYTIDGQQCTDFCVLRSWRTDLPRGACVIVETSIDHVKAKPMFNAIRGVVLASRYLIEPCGSGRSRVMHLARVDVKGKTPEWYNKSYGHIASHFLTKIRLAFKNVTDGPESKV